jgi:hypothetical protein
LGAPLLEAVLEMFGCCVVSRKFRGVMAGTLLELAWAFNAAPDKVLVVPEAVLLEWAWTFNVASDKVLVVPEVVSGQVTIIGVCRHGFHNFLEE